MVGLVTPPGAVATMMVFGPTGKFGLVDQDRFDRQPDRVGREHVERRDRRRDVEDRLADDGQRAVGARLGQDRGGLVLLSVHGCRPLS